MSTAEGAPLLPGSGNALMRNGASRATRCVLLSLAALFAVSAVSAVAVIEHKHAAVSSTSVADVYSRSQLLLDQNPRFCDTCAVVIPSDTYKGKGLGGAIDSAQCVVRFNHHGPLDCESEDKSKCPSPEDYGTKDTVRVMNGNPEMMDLMDNDPCFGGYVDEVEESKGKNGKHVKKPKTASEQCRRQIVTWMDSSPRAMKFFTEHPNTETIEALIEVLELPDPHDLIRGFAWNQSLPRPGYASSAFITLNVLKDPRICGQLFAFGLETLDDSEAANHGYADDPHKKISPAHDYVLEHDFYKKAVDESWPGWDNVKVVQMEQPHLGRERE